MFTDFQLLAIGFALILLVSFLSWLIVGYDPNLKNRVVDNIEKANSPYYQVQKAMSKLANYED